MEGCCRQSFSARSGHSLIAKNSGGLPHAASPSGMDDRQLLGMQWEWQMYIDASLPFGLLSAPIIFSAVVDALKWNLTYKIGSWVAYY